MEAWTKLNHEVGKWLLLEESERVVAEALAGLITNSVTMRESSMPWANESMT